MTMFTVNLATYKEMVKWGVFEQNEVVIAIGPSGLGKTHTARQVAAEYEHPISGKPALYHPVLLGQYQDVDLKGTPWSRSLEETPMPGDKQFTVWSPASTLPFKGNPNFPTDTLILLHLDEITSANIPVFGICYQLIEERRVGEHELMDNVRIICSGNREVDKGIVNRFPMPLCDRLVWCEVEVSIKEWSFHAQKIGVAPEGIAFINWRKELLMNYDPSKPEKVFTTARSWVKALTKFYQHPTMPVDVKKALMAGTIGTGPTTEFFGFIEHWQGVLKLIPSILKDPLKAELPEDLGVRYALALNLSGEMKLSNVDTINKYLFRMPDDMTVMVWNLATARDEGLYKAPGFITFSKKCSAIWE